MEGCAGQVRCRHGGTGRSGDGRVAPIARLVVPKRSEARRVGTRRVELPYHLLAHRHAPDRRLSRRSLLGSSAAGPSLPRQGYSPHGLLTRDLLAAASSSTTCSLGDR